MGPTAKEQAEYRRQHLEYVERSKLLQKARNRAMGELQHRHRQEYEDIYKEICQQYNVAPKWRWSR